jgi:hypothetical protein
MVRILLGSRWSPHPRDGALLLVADLSPNAKVEDKGRGGWAVRRYQRVPLTQKQFRFLVIVGWWPGRCGPQDVRDLVYGTTLDGGPEDSAIHQLRMAVGRKIRPLGLTIHDARGIRNGGRGYEVGELQP